MTISHLIETVWALHWHLLIVVVVLAWLLRYETVKARNTERRHQARRTHQAHLAAVARRRAAMHVVR